ncbi:nicotinate-nucleotide adenylyltransferase [Pseudoduganella namucuonensis]|uniref:Probable nicotinate-nucleotide adenylyltransferase n=1 Tax=Pseudoduganella namucuonensis TaxID=1035707 RepID=A0A1I7FQX5_9BURK|nr:nicotinate-nucleotide adenylyltransferase [Pseudoduganella namucuonensis]SFU38580.1 nicotinate-nucleotide adenylyltransferase [Pseudoduganella namucuonensis]
MTYRVALLGGTFDPVHHGHVALGAHFMRLLGADELRVLPAGAPWQKAALGAAPEQRAEMAGLAFAGQPFKVVVDTQEITRGGPTYTVETLRALRAELGPETSIAFLMGADQLRRLDTWRDWHELFGLAHICAAARPGFTLDQLPPAVAQEMARRAGTPEQLRNTPAGLACLAPDLALDMSSTGIRAALQRGNKPDSLISPVVLDYIEQHNLYK